MKNTTINRQAIKTIARALGPLNEKVVYVGGAVVSLYINDPAADDVRPTKDIDISLRIASVAELEKVRQAMIARGFMQSAEDDVMCRFRFKDIKVDVMSTQAVGWAPANPWFAPGFDHLESVPVEGEEISILPLSYFLASKFTAFRSRGSLDPRTSHDLEDITYILDNRIDLVEVLSKAPADVLDFLKEAFRKMLSDKQMQEALLGNLYHESQSERFEMIMNKMRRVVSVVRNSQP